VMPNHFHGILLIGGSVVATKDHGCVDADDASVRAVHELPVEPESVEVRAIHESPIEMEHTGLIGAIHELPGESQSVEVGAIHELPLPPGFSHGGPHQEDENGDWVVSRRTMLLPRLIGRFKMISAKRINESRGSPAFAVWQRNYFEHVIRSDKGLERIRQYIMENPARWHLDRQNPERVRNDDRYPW